MNRWIMNIPESINFFIIIKIMIKHKMTNIHEAIILLFIIMIPHSHKNQD